MTTETLQAVELQTSPAATASVIWVHGTPTMQKTVIGRERTGKSIDPKERRTPKE